MNIVVFGLNHNLTLEYAKKFAKILKTKLLDASALFEKTVMQTVDKPLFLLEETLQQQEADLCKQLSLKDGVVAIADDMFLSNQNHKIFKNSQKILIKVQNNGKLKQKIENLLQTHANFVVDATTDFKDIEKFFKNF